MKDSLTTARVMLLEGRIELLELIKSLLGEAVIGRRLRQGARAPAENGSVLVKIRQC